ncbi:MAG: 50S ribosomal protein L35 [Gemmatales bacterium]|nr:MAG: 50S ribosomal protein L35 [Gemmatales bacterium]
MPKVKIHKGAKKRFRVTANKRVKRAQAGKSHLNSSKTGKRKRQLRRPVIVEGKLAKTYLKLIGDA